MAIGDTVQAGLGRMDFSAFQTAGAAQARANEAFGNALGQAATAYFKGKEKKRQKNALQNYLESNGVSEEDAKAIVNGGPEVLDLFNKKQAADQQMKIAQMQNRTSIANSKRGAMSRNADLEFQREKFEAGQKLLEEQKALNESLARFSIQPVETPTPEFSALQQQYRPEQIPGTPEFIAMQESEPMGARPSIIAKTITEQPDFQRFVKQDSPAVAQLPDLFKPQGRRIQDAVESGELSNQAGMMAINNLSDLAPEPLDPFKIRDELRKTKEFDQGQDAISFSPDRNILQLGDTEFGISGKFGNEAEVIKLKSEAIPQYQNMNAVMNQLIELGEKRKNEVYMSNADKTLAASLSRQLQGLLREDILGPGTVTEPERQILEQIVQNPTTWMDFAGKTQDKINSLKGIRRNAFNKLKTRLTGLGLDVAEVGQSKSPAQNFDKQTSTGLGFTEIDLDQL